jgi:hypothetical protein
MFDVRCVNLRCALLLPSAWKGYKIHVTSDLLKLKGREGEIIHHNCLDMGTEL